MDYCFIKFILAYLFISHRLHILWLYYSEPFHDILKFSVSKFITTGGNVHELFCMAVAQMSNNVLLLFRSTMRKLSASVKGLIGMVSERSAYSNF